MEKRGATNADYDSPWKVALHKYLRWFLAFFFPEIHADIDWKRGYQALDKEFQQVIRDAQVGKQVADMLFKVWLDDGDECWLFIHVEIQGSYEKAFARRMFDYNTSVYKLYNRETISLAVLCDERSNWRPSTFGYGRWGSRTEITFPMIKLLDYAGDLEALERNDNPFSVIVLAHLQAQATRDDAARRVAWKFRLVRGLYERKLSKDDVRELFRLLDWILALPEELQEQFREQIYQYEKEKCMPYLSSLERRGLEQGQAEGRTEGFREAIAVSLEEKFGRSARKLLTRLREINDVAELRRLARIVSAAQTVDDVRQHLT